MVQGRVAVSTVALLLTLHSGGLNWHRHLAHVLSLFLFDANIAS
jgi:hypothetical protein